jgi:small nuclear ribonucleoprotein
VVLCHKTRISSSFHRHLFKRNPENGSKVAGLGFSDSYSVSVIPVNASRPTELLQRSIGAQVLVELKARKKIKGRLRGFDQHLNLILEDADEMGVDPETNTESVERIETVIVRGDNVVIISPPPGAPQPSSEGE